TKISVHRSCDPPIPLNANSYHSSHSSHPEAFPQNRPVVRDDDSHCSRNTSPPGATADGPAIAPVHPSSAQSHTPLSCDLHSQRREYTVRVNHRALLVPTLDSTPLDCGADHSE